MVLNIPFHFLLFVQGPQGMPVRKGEQEGDRGPRPARPIGPIAAPGKGLRGVFTPLVDYEDDSDGEPDSPGVFTYHVAQTA